MVFIRDALRCRARQAASLLTAPTAKPSRLTSFNNRNCMILDFDGNGVHALGLVKQRRTINIALRSLNDL